MRSKRLFICILASFALQISGSFAAAAEPREKPSYPVTVWCIADPVLRVRNLPSTDGEIVDKIPYGAQVLVLGEKGAPETIGGKTGVWVEVQFHGKQGYAFDAFFSDKEPAITVEGVAKKTAALVNGFRKDTERCDIELVDSKGLAFLETAESVELCRDDLLGKRVKLSYAPCQKGKSCSNAAIHAIQVIPIFQ